MIRPTSFLFAAFLLFASSDIAALPALAQQHAASAAAERGDEPLSPGDSRLHLAAVTAPSTRTLSIYLERGGQRQRFGTLVETLVHTDGTEFVRVQRLESARGTQVDSIRATIADLSPRAHYSANPARIVDLRFDDEGVVTGTYAPADPNADALAIDDTLEAPAFDSNVIDLVARAVPLEHGFESAVRTYERALADAANTDVMYSVRVSGHEELDGREVAVVEFTKGANPTRLYVDLESRTTWKMEAEVAPGTTIVMIPVDRE